MGIDGMKGTKCHLPQGNMAAGMSSVCMSTRLLPQPSKAAEKFSQVTLTEGDEWGKAGQTEMETENETGMRLVQ